MKQTRVLAAVIKIALVIAALGCFIITPGEVAPTPDIDAMVEVRLNEERATQPTATPIVVVKEVTPIDTPSPTSIPEPTSTVVPTGASNPTSSPSHTPPPISMALEAVSGELLACVQTAMGNEQYNAITSGRQSVTPQQFYIVMPCIMQYPQETKAIMEMFGLDMGTIMGAGSPTPTAQPKPYTPVPTPTSTPYKH